VASRLDPLLFRASGGRLTVFGPPAMPMLTLTMRAVFDTALSVS